MEPKFKVGDYVKCNCGCGQKGIILYIESYGKEEVFYLVNNNWFMEHRLLIDQEYLNEQKIKKLLGVK